MTQNKKEEAKMNDQIQNGQEQDSNCPLAPDHQGHCSECEFCFAGTCCSMSKNGLCDTPSEISLSVTCDDYVPDLSKGGCAHLSCIGLCGVAGGDEAYWPGCIEVGKRYPHPDASTSARINEGTSDSISEEPAETRVPRANPAAGERIGFIARRSGRRPEICLLTENVGEVVLVRSYSGTSGHRELSYGDAELLLKLGVSFNKAYVLSVDFQPRVGE